jgi:NADH-quinone oxidoreductase subunit G
MRAGPAVLRVLPRTNEAVNEEWISDKTRYAVDGLSRQRLDRPFIRVGGKLKPASWGEALELVASKLKAAKPERVGVIAGDLQDAESMKAALDLFGGMGVKSLDCRQDGMALGGGPRESWLLNSTIQGLEDADVVLLVGTNPRLEAPVLNARLRKRWMAGALRIGVVGEAADLTYDYAYFGSGPSALNGIAKAKGEFVTALKSAKRPAIIVGAGALSRPDSASVLAAAAGLAKTFGMTWNVLHTAASRVGGLDLGFVPQAGGKTAAQLVAKAAPRCWCCWAPTRWISARPTPSSSTSAPTATPARTGRT